MTSSVCFRSVIAGAILVAPPAGPACAQRSGGFVDFRYASRTSMTLFAALPAPRHTFVVGMVQNPRTDYREMVAGVSDVLALGRASARIVLAGAYASDGWYGQLYVLPALATGPVRVSGILLGYVPLETEGTRQLHVNPITTTVRLTPKLEAGGSYVLSGPEEGPDRHSVGPVVQLSFGYWSTSLTMLAGLGATRGEVRIGLTARR